jgi:hypothetical protein
MKSTILAFFIFFGTGLSPQADISDKVVALLKTGNSKELSAHFASKIDLAVGDKDDVYSRAQAELILKKFFSTNQPESVTIVHSGTSKMGIKYTICNMTTSSGSFRVSFHIKEIGGKGYIQKLSIEESDE